MKRTCPIDFDCCHRPSATETETRISLPNPTITPEPRQRIHEPDILVLHQEPDLVAVRAASETMEKPLAVDHGERRRILVVERAQRRRLGG